MLQRPLDAAQGFVRPHVSRRTSRFFHTSSSVNCKQRQGPGLAFDVGQQPLGQARLQLAADLERGPLDRLAQLVLLHRPDLHQVRVEHVVEPRERAQAPRKSDRIVRTTATRPPGAAAACSRLAKNAGTRLLEPGLRLRRPAAGR